MGNELASCSITVTLSVLSGKWKWAIVYHIAQEKVIRYGQIKAKFPSIAHRTLSQQLKELEEDGIIHREQYNQIPPKVEYSLTEKGKTLVPILTLMSEWGESNRPSRQNLGPANLG